MIEIVSMEGVQFDYEITLRVTLNFISFSELLAITKTFSVTLYKGFLGN